MIVSRLVADANRKLTEEVGRLSSQLSTLTTNDNIEPYKDITIDPTIIGGEGLEVAKCLPIFDGENYVSWRTALLNAMKVYEPCKGGSRYFSVVNIVRNKIIGKANDVLTSHGTPLNVDAIIGRLDLTYSDKRSVHMLESELSNMRQDRKSLQEFYDDVTKVLTLIINKTIMSYGRSLSTIVHLAVVGGLK